MRKMPGDYNLYSVNYRCIKTMNIHTLVCSKCKKMSKTDAKNCKIYVKVTKKCDI